MDLTLLGTALGHLDQANFKVKYLHDGLRKKKSKLCIPGKKYLAFFIKSNLLSIKYHFQC